jgi:hypothetical protein
MRKNGKKEGKKTRSTQTSGIAWNARRKEHFSVSSVQFCCFAELVGIFFFEGSSDGVAFVQSENSPIGLASECEKALVWCKKLSRKSERERKPKKRSNYKHGEVATSRR